MGAPEGLGFGRVSLSELVFFDELPSTWSGVARFAHRLPSGRGIEGSRTEKRRANNAALRRLRSPHTNP